MFRRSKPLRRRKQLRRGDNRIERRTRPRRVSTRLAAELRVYYNLRQVYLTENPWCEAGTVITRARLPASYAVPACAARAAEVHHLRGRGPHLNDVSTFCACCHACHVWIHDHGQKARELGLLY